MFPRIFLIEATFSLHNNLLGKTTTLDDFSQLSSSGGHKQISDSLNCHTTKKISKRYKKNKQRELKFPSIVRFEWKVMLECYGVA